MTSSPSLNAGLTTLPEFTVIRGTEETKMFSERYGYSIKSVEEYKHALARRLNKILEVAYEDRMMATRTLLYELISELDSAESTKGENKK